MTTVDCMIVGFNDYDFDAYVDLVAAGGTDSGAFQDLRLSYVECQGRRLRALDAINEFQEPPRPRLSLHNSDFLWPVVTYLGTFLARHGFSFDYVNLFQQEKEKLARRLRAGEVRTVAITTTLYVSPHPIMEIVEFVRSCRPDVTVIVGGPYIANLTAVAEGADLESVLGYLGADFYVVGREGEAALAQILAALRDGTDLGAVKNLVYRHDGGFRHTSRDPESNDLAANLVDYSLFEPAHFTSFVTTRTAKSCPFSCSFCGFPQRAGKYTYLTVEDVRRELDAIARIPGVDTVTFIDDTFNVPKVRFREILQMMIDRDYGFHWNCYYRSDHGDRRTIELMAAAGCEGVFLGVESGSDAQLARMNKTARQADYLDALAAFRDTGISTYASLIIGFPGETEETVAETESLLRDGRPDFYRAQLWYADPVTPVWQRRAEFGIRGRGFNWRHASMSWQQACRHIERLFLTVDEPIWMPQFGFEQWSVFYLMRKGMSMDQVKTFVRAFNAVIRAQLGDRDDSLLLDKLRRRCQLETVAATRGAA